MALGHGARAFAFQRTRRGIARIGEEWLLTCFAFGVEAVEFVPRQKHFSSDFEAIGPVAGL